MKFTFRSSLYCKPTNWTPTATVANFAFEYAACTDPRWRGTCWMVLPTSAAFATPPSVTLPSSKTYAAENRHDGPTRYSRSVWKPRTRVLPRFCFCASVADKVTFEMGLLLWLSNHVSRTETLRAGATLTPASPPTSRSGPSWSLGRVVTAPTENCLYNSVSVGARNPELAAPQTLT